MNGTVRVNPIGIEVLDDPAADPRLVQRMLADLQRSNRWLGGTATLRRGLAQLLDSGNGNRVLTLLDIGAGAGDLAHATVAWGQRRGITIRPLAIERHRTAALLAGHAGIDTVFGCATALPFHCGGVDIVLMAQLLHHFDDDTAIAILREAHRVARLGVIVTDLRPAPGAAFGFRLAATLLGLHRVTIADGVTSLARGRPAAALADLARRAGAQQPTAHDGRMARVVVVWHKDH